MNQGRVFFASDAPLRVVCAWCQSEMKPGREPVSHGICNGCFAKELGYTPEQMKAELASREASKRKEEAAHGC